MEQLFKADGSPAPEGVPVSFDAKGKPFVVVLSPCSRCGGSGYLPIPVDGGRCFRCYASHSKVYERAVYKLYPKEKVEKLIAARSARQAKKEAAAKAKVDAAVERMKAQFGADFEAVKAVAESGANAFVADVFSKGHRWELNDKQVNAVKAAVARIKEREALKESKVMLAQHLGSVGQKSVFDLKVVAVFSVPSYYSSVPVRVYKMEDANGNEVVYKGNSSSFDPEKGDRVKFEALVKKHGEYKGVKQTVVKLPKMLEHAPSAEEKEVLS